MSVANKYTSTMSQHDDGSTVLTIFSTVQQAKDYFLSANAQQCITDNSTQVEWALVEDDDGNNTKLKTTVGFDLSGQGQAYNNRMIELINADDWGAGNHYTTVEASDSSEHLF